MSWLRKFFWLSFRHNFHIRTRPLPGKNNVYADRLSRLIHSPLLSNKVFFSFIGYLTQLDLRAKFFSVAAYAHATLNTRRSQWRTYVRFCAKYNLISIPAADRTIIRFLVHLSTYCKYSTIINYLSAINVLPALWL